MSEEEALFWSQAITREQILSGSDLRIKQCHKHPICRHKHVCVPKKWLLRCVKYRETNYTGLPI